jgi:tRNA1(Val) A37 N6-methylase TrmN6
VNEQLFSPEICSDTLFDGKLICWQPLAGYRFSIDSVLVSHFAKIKNNEKILDLGTGSGIIGLILLFRHSEKISSLVGYDIQKNLIDIARKNSHENGFQQIFKVIHGDVADTRTRLDPESFSLVISNPPFFLPGSGRISISQEKQIARHQSDLTLLRFVDSAAYCVKNKGKVVLVYPAEFSCELFEMMRSRRIEPKRIQFVYSYPGDQSEAKLLLVEGIKNGGRGQKILSPFYIYDSRNGSYSRQMLKMYDH